MDKAELQWFKKELEGNPRLLKELKLREEINKAIAEPDIMDLRQQLGAIYMDQYQGKRVRAFRHNKQRVLFAVAAAVITALVTIAINPFNRSYSNQELLLMYYTPYDAGMSYRSADTEEGTLLKAAYENYRDNRFEEAISYFEAALEKDPSNMASNFYTGMSYMELKKYMPAENQFEIVTNDRNNLYLEQAEWYLGLCYLASDKRNQAYTLFYKISGSNSFYKNQAKKLLKQMD